MIRSRRVLMREMQSEDGATRIRATREFRAIAQDAKALTYIYLDGTYFPLTPRALRAHRKYAGTDWGLSPDKVVATHPWRAG